MSAPGSLLLDNEAVQALRTPAHAEHRRVLSHIEANFGRRSGDEQRRVLVPTAVRVEAGWNRTDPGSATLNRLGAIDATLDARGADVAAEIIQRTGVSVADAHLGATALGVAGDVVVLTSDPGDMRLVAGPKHITAIRI